MVKLKNWWKSFTVWLGGLVVILSQVPPEMVTMLHPDLKDWFMSAIGLALIYNRIFRTNQAVTMTAAFRPVSNDK